MRSNGATGTTGGHHCYLRGIALKNNSKHATARGASPSTPWLARWRAQRSAAHSRAWRRRIVQLVQRHARKRGEVTASKQSRQGRGIAVVVHFVVGHVSVTSCTNMNTSLTFRTLHRAIVQDRVCVFTQTCAMRVFWCGSGSTDGSQPSFQERVLPIRTRDQVEPEYIRIARMQSVFCIPDVKDFVPASDLSVNSEIKAQRTESKSNASFLV